MNRFPALASSAAMAVVTCCGLVAGTGSAARAAPTAAGHRVAAATAASGSWGIAQLVPGSAALDAGGVNSVSCASPGNCAAGGDGFIADETDGAWGTARTVSGVVTSVSCGSAGNCAAGGNYGGSSGHQQAFVMDETNGSWGAVREVPGTAALNAGGFAGVNSVTCASAGDCAAGGWYSDSSGHYQAFTADETNGSWSTARQVPGTAALNTGGDAGVNSVSCASPGNCAAGGEYFAAGTSAQGEVFVVDETNGSWGTARQVPGTAALNTGGYAWLNSVSCASAGNCAAVGYYRDSSGNTQAFTADETNGSWGTARQVPGTAALNAGGDAEAVSVSCPAAGNCAASGWYSDSSHHYQAFTADETNGSWGTARQVPGTAALNTGGDAGAVSVSCPAAGNCAAAGGFSYDTDGYSRNQPFVVNEATGASATSTSISLSRATVSYLDEQAERVSVTVTSPGGTPGGTVFVRWGLAPLCTITLASGSGSCTPSGTEVPPGATWLTATYGGGAGFAVSVSSKAGLTVTIAAAPVPWSTSSFRPAPPSPWSGKAAAPTLPRQR